MTTRAIPFILPLLLAACAESSAYEYYDLRADQEQHDCQCSTDDGDAIEQCIAAAKESRERERACALDYVEHSRKRLKRVEPIYSCLLDGVAEYVDCFQREPECRGVTTTCETFHPDTCTLEHFVQVPGEVARPDDAMRGMQAIWDCAAAE